MSREKRYTHVYNSRKFHAPILQWEYSTRKESDECGRTSTEIGSTITSKEAPVLFGRGFSLLVPQYYGSVQDRERQWTMLSSHELLKEDLFAIDSYFHAYHREATKELKITRLRQIAAQCEAIKRDAERLIEELNGSIF